MSAERTVLVLDGEQRAALAVVRSLGRAGYSVHVSAGTPWAVAARSRGATPHLIATQPLVDASAYAGEIAQLALRVGATTVIPVTDASMEAILEHHALLPSSARLPCASLATYNAASDKLRVHEAAAAAGLAIEETVILRSKAERAPDDVRVYPGVVKPYRSVVGSGAAREKLTVRLVDDRAACQAALDALPPEAYPVLVQRRVRGSGIGVFVGRWNGRTFARFAHRRVREKPPAGGVSVLSESIALPPALQQSCEALLDALQWQGVAMVECKEDAERGGWRVMEINGRFWGSLQLAIDSGVDFPALLLRAADGATMPPPPAWRVGQRLRWEWGDVDHLWLRMRRSKASLQLPPEAPGRLAALGAFFGHRIFRDRLEVFRWDDPMPFVAESLSWLRLVR